MKKETKKILDSVLFVLGIIAIALLVYGIIKALMFGQTMIAVFGLLVSIIIQLYNIKNELPRPKGRGINVKKC